MKSVILPILLFAALAAGADVGVDTILAPSGRVDSGQAVIPRCIVANYDGSADNVWVHFTIVDWQGPGYPDSVCLPELPGGVRETAEFAGIVFEGRDSMTAMAWTTCAEDTNPANDTCRVKFLVRVLDIAVIELIQPHDTLDSGAAVYPTCRVWNYGNQSVNFDVEFSIGAYLSVRNLTLPAGGSTVVAAPDSLVPMPGVWVYRVEAIVPGDMHPENNVLGETLCVRGTIAHDAGIGIILSPPAFVDTATTFTPSASIGCGGSEGEVFWVFFLITDWSREDTTYLDSVFVEMGPGQVDTVVSFEPVRIRVPDLYRIACRVALAGDQNSTNDEVEGPLRVVPALGFDIGVVRIISPPGRIPPDTTITLAAVWKNYSELALSFTAYFALFNPYGARVYSEWTPEVDLDPLAETTLYSVPVNVGSEGGWAVFCSTYAHGDTNPLNDTLTFRFEVGIEESFKPQASSYKPAATVIRGVMWVGDRRPGTGDRMELLDASGRRLMVLHPGANDVSGLAPGVYFVRDEGRGAGDVGRMRKVIIQR